jgi:YegS/Rv2252/BmrU family lipid kinase
LIYPLPDPYGSRHLVIVNPAAGQASTERVLRSLAGAFAARRASFDILETRGAGDAEGMARMAARAGYRAVVAVGGDGTVGEVITGLAGTGMPLGIVPKGTGNQLACNLGIPQAVEAAVDVVVNGYAQPIDLGRLPDGRYFAVTAGAGWDATIMAAATRELKDRWGFGAYLYAGLRTGITPPSTLYRITADGETVEVNAAMVLVANMGHFASRLLAVDFRIAPGVSFQDGKLDVCIFAPRSLTDVAAMLWRMARRRYSGDNRLIYLQAEEIHIETDSPVITETDGEPIGVTPLSVRAVPGGVNVLVPG